MKCRPWLIGLLKGITYHSLRLSCCEAHWKIGDVFNLFQLCGYFFSKRNMGAHTSWFDPRNFDWSINYVKAIYSNLFSCIWVWNFVKVFLMQSCPGIAWNISLIIDFRTVLFISWTGACWRRFQFLTWRQLTIRLLFLALVPSIDRISVSFFINSIIVASRNASVNLTPI